jgi:hypothetical protein
MEGPGGRITISSATPSSAVSLMNRFSVCSLFFRFLFPFLLFLYFENCGVCTDIQPVEISMRVNVAKSGQRVRVLRTVFQLLAATNCAFILVSNLCV